MTDNLISREALEIEIKNQIAYFDDKSNHQSNKEELLRYSNTSYGLRLALNHIYIAPTVEERQQGLWIKNSFKDFGAFGDYDYKCSNCQKVSGGKYNFCSNCGADMRGGLKNDRE